MSAFTIERDLTDVDKTLERAKREAAKFGSLWEGDTERGRYDLRTPLGHLAGTYVVAGKRVRFEIERKPAIVPRGMIERILDAFLKGS